MWTEEHWRKNEKPPVFFIYDQQSINIITYLQHYKVLTLFLNNMLRYVYCIIIIVPTVCVTFAFKWFFMHVSKITKKKIIETTKY